MNRIDNYRVYSVSKFLSLFQTVLKLKICPFSFISDFAKRLSFFAKTAVLFSLQNSTASSSLPVIGCKGCYVVQKKFASAVK